MGPSLTSIEADIFGEALIANDLTAEVNQYITEVNKRESCDILAYWSRNNKVYPSLSLMASCCLGIPATSAPSERVFSRSKTIIGSQKHSLSSSSIEHLLCVKEWYQKFDEMLDTSTVSPELLKQCTNDKIKDDEDDTDTDDTNDTGDTDDTNDDNLDNEDENGDNLNFFN
ncbi:hypothetical protein PGT21_005750 [Puccinia graminis f. sp. tritici]|uniref:HAT C-terminal dimerisation domain-containing protein n=2 Tax=Puccinia graminis f. sp. tritici TaxID=56615 RepID=A0A5B0LM90_PUCGR|nr:hypothetical protein PGT21_005750 [Puccinia graminis f. sp. tritici]